MPPTGSTRPRRLISPVIAVSLRIVRPVISEMSAMNIATPALGPSFGMAPAGTWIWMSLFSKRLAIDAERRGAVLDERQRRLRAFLHHVAELAGEDQLAGAGNARRLDEQDVAADRRPGEAGGDARHAGAHRHFVLELRRAEDRHEIVARRCGSDRSALGDAHRGIAQHLADLALEAAHAGLAGIVADDVAQRVVGDLDLAGLEPVRLQLPAHQIALGDLAASPPRCSRQGSMISMRSRSGPGMVSSMLAVAMNTTGYRSNGTREIIVAERVVLLGVEHFEQRRAGIALNAGAELVDLVEHHDAIARAGLADAPG